MVTTPFDTSIDPDRGPPKFGATENWTVASPVPLAAEFRVTNPDAATAVQEHADGITIPNEPLPPVVGNDCAKGLIVKSQAVVEAVNVRFQPPAILPTLLPASSNA